MFLWMKLILKVACDIVCKSNYFLFITHISHFDYTIIYLLGDCHLIVVLVPGFPCAVHMLYPELLLQHVHLWTLDAVRKMI